MTNLVGDDDYDEGEGSGSKTPYVIGDAAEIDAFPPIPFPNLSSGTPAGWRLVETWFVDSSGFGRPGEAAHTVDEFKEILRRSFAEDPERGYGVVGAGQFQVHVGAFEPTSGAASKRGRAGSKRARKKSADAKLPPPKVPKPPMVSMNFGAGLPPEGRNDPIAFVKGVADGWGATHRKDLDNPANDYADAYKAGYRIGLKVRSGEVPIPPYVGGVGAQPPHHGRAGSAGSERGPQRHRYGAPPRRASTKEEKLRDRLEKLREMTVERGCSVAEAKTAARLAEEIERKLAGGGD